MAEGVEFEEDKDQFSKAQPVSAMPVPLSPISVVTDEEKRYIDSIQTEPKMVQWLIKHGYAKNPAFGRALLFMAILVNALITYFVIKNFL